MLPFSGELTIRQLLDAVKHLLGISLDWANFPDLGTSCGPTLSITIDRVSIPFKRKLSELTAEERAKLQLWIQLRWRDKLETEDEHYDGTTFLWKFSYMGGMHGETRPGSERERGKLTLDRMEAMVQATIWQSLSGRK
jgi:hypothetical protein